MLAVALRPQPGNVNDCDHKSVLTEHIHVGLARQCAARALSIGSRVRGQAAKHRRGETTFVVFEVTINTSVIGRSRGTSFRNEVSREMKVCSVNQCNE